MTKETIFNYRKRVVSRTHIPRTEIIASLLILLSLAGVIFWAILQRNSFNPADRDIPPEMLESGEEKLYPPPLKQWTEDTAVSQSAGPNLGIFTATIIDDTWQVGTRLKQFTPETLFEKIDGEADKFIKQGFKSLYFIGLIAHETGDEIDIELFDQGNIGGSLGIFSEYASYEVSLHTEGDAVYILTPSGTIGRKGRFFFRIIGNRESDIIRQKSVLLVKALAGLTESVSDAPVEYTLFTQTLKIDPARVTFTGENVFQFDFARDFWFAAPDPGLPWRLFLRREPSPDHAARLFQQIVAEQKNDYQIKENAPDMAVMWHPYLKNWFAIAHQGTFVFGIENAPKIETVTSGLNRMKQGLPHEP